VDDKGISTKDELMQDKTIKVIKGGEEVLGR
jgi:hypothetical protein